MRTGTVITIAFILLLPFPAAAQFFTAGDDPGSTKWSSIGTKTFNVIYPTGLDSLARIYGHSLETLSEKASLTIGMRPNCNYLKPMPVILHTQSSYSNGVVTWCPRRVDFLTMPDPYNPLPMKWEDQLTVHELRHVAQMQFGRNPGYRWLYYLTGEIWSGAASAIYPGPAFLEGDAVAAETELSLSGRGRSASFLEYYKASFLAGDRRDFWKWRYGSEKYYTPDHYKAGYLMIAGPRYLYDEPLFTKKYFDRIKRYGLPFWNFDKTVKEVSGGINFKQTFAAMTDTLTAMWRKDIESRGPFIATDTIARPGRLFTEYTRTALIGPDLYCVESGIDRPSRLVRISPDGKKRTVTAFSSGTSEIKSDGQRLYWSELRSDHRWSLRNSSVIRTMGPDGRMRDLTKPGRRLFNPSLSADGARLCATEYLPDGRSALVIFDPLSGEELSSISVGQGLQITESAWDDDGAIVAIGIDDNGAGLYRFDGSSVTVLLRPQYACLKSLSVRQPGSRVHFISDLNGTDELYCIDRDGIRRVTNTPLGISSPVFSQDGFLYFSALSTDGRLLCRTDADKLPVRTVDFSQRAQWPIADKLSAQVQTITPEPADTSTTEPKKYVKAAHLFKFHSWLPVYAEYDAISSMSFETIQKKAGLGAMGFFQNELGTMSGYVGYNAWTPGLGWRNYLHASFTYSGLYPVLEGQFSVGKENNASLRAYIPFNFSSGGWQRGVVPQAKAFVDKDGFGWSVAVRAYTMRPVAASGTYPRLGIGGEVGYGSATRYASMYGYLPGILNTHGIKLTAIVQNTQVMSIAQSGIYYALPIVNLDWSFLCPVFYLKNLELTAKYLFTYAWADAKNGHYNTIGANLVLHMANLAFVPYDTRIGVGYEFCPGLAKQHYWNFIFSIDL